MGSYSTLYIGSIEVASFKNSYDPYLLNLFQEDDKRIEVLTIKEASLEDYYGDSDTNQNITLVQYKCKISIARDRLNLMGYTKEVAEKVFYKNLKSKIESYKNLKKSLSGEAELNINTFIKVLSKLTVKKWSLAFVEARDNKYHHINYLDQDYYTYSPILQYMLSEEWYGFPSYDTCSFLRILIDCHEDSDELMYDFTDLAAGGWVDNEEDLISILDDHVTASYSAARRFIVMTEGSTDSWVLERSLKLLYPHLASYFRFLDFEGAKIGGGAGVLANTIKAFSGAGIINRIIALFDNDTAAESAMRTLINVTLPKNIFVEKYPYLPFAKCYPTIGPSGIANMDINGLACSIELYLGEEVLKINHSDLSPIQWRGYDPYLKKYQGEVLNKTEILKRFDDKLTSCEQDRQLINNYDWNGIFLIINFMLTAFHKQDAQAILISTD